MNRLQHFSNGDIDLPILVKENGEINFDAEQAAIGFGIVDTSKGYTNVRWNNVNKYLGFSATSCGKVKKGDFITEPQFYKLAFKANNQTAEKFQDWVTEEVLPTIRETGSYSINKNNDSKKKPLQDDLLIRRMNAEARLKNANARQAKLLVELSKGATTEVNKALLQDKAVEALDGKKLLEMPTLREHFYDTDEIAKQVGILSKSGKPHGTAVSQIIKKYIEVEDNESEILPETNGGWSGSVTKYTKSVIAKLHEWLKEKQYPALIKGDSKNYHVTYDFDI